MNRICWTMLLAASSILITLVTAASVQEPDSYIPGLNYTPVEELPHHSPLSDHLDNAEGYVMAIDEIASLCQQLDAKLTSIEYRECLSIGLESSGAYSILRKAIAVRDVLPKSGDIAGKVLLVGGIHGDEYSAVTIVFKWLQQLNNDEGGQFHWRVVPVLNPDGLLMPPKKSQRMNANGVDLNRNFPTPNWEEEATDYWVNRTRKSKRRYPGTAPLSEPESRWLSEQIDEFQPDAVISVHAPHGIVDFDGPQKPPDSLGPLELRLLGTYPGSMGRYIGVYKSIPLLTVELESALSIPEDDDADDIWRDTITWLEDRVIVEKQESNTEQARSTSSE